MTEGTEVPSFYCMSSNTATQHIETLIHKVFEEGQCGEYYIVDITVSPGNLIVVFVDGDEGVSLDTCKEISRTLEAVLDAEPSMGGVYTLEVSSPGVSRPLKFQRQYPKHVGRTLRVKQIGGKEVLGILKHITADTIVLELEAKDKKSLPEMIEIAFADIKEAVIKIQFGKNQPKGNKK